MFFRIAPAFALNTPIPALIAPILTLIAPILALITIILILITLIPALIVSILALIATIPFHPALIPFPRKVPLFSLFHSFSILFLLLFLNNKSFRCKSFVLSAPEINLSPTALTMLTRSSVQFLFDSCLIPVQFPPRSHRVFCLNPV